MIRTTGMALLLLTSAVALADEPISERAEMRSGGELEVSNVAGAITVTGWSRQEVQVEGTLWEGAKRLIFDAQGDRTVIEVELPRNTRNTRGSRLNIKVPFDTDVVALAVSADITVNSVAGDKRLQSVSGDIRGEVNGGSIELRTVSGDIDVTGRGDTRDVRVAAVSGNLMLSGITGELSIETVSGDITVDDASVSRLDLEAVSGDIDVLADLHSGGRLGAHTVSGSALIRLQDVSDAEIMLESFSGDIGSLFGHDAARTSRYAPGRELRLQLGSGKTSVRVETLSGDISVRPMQEPAGDIRDLTSRRHSKHDDD